jgi:hypothetical protein
MPLVKELLTLPKLPISSPFFGVRVKIMVFNAISTIFQLYRGCQFYWWRIPEYLEKTTDLSLTHFIK